ncbi:MAG: 50S ribosomal protein L11 methyltransferase, partial [Chitinophagaceae bacterium]
MNSYIQIEYQNISQEQSDLLIAQLSEIGFDGFEEEENKLKAFIDSNNFDETLLQDISTPLHVDFSKTVIEETNWNKVWESNFDPVIVDDFVAVRADFHEPIKDVELEIIITPKMSFGTGHHATTYMMLQQMIEEDFKDKIVFDFGTGTGVLAIL